MKLCVTAASCCYSLAGWLAVDLCKHSNAMTVTGVQLLAVLFRGTALLEQNRCSELEQSLSWEAQLDASWLLPGQTSSQSQACWKVQHRDTQMSLNKLNLAPTWSISWSSGLAPVDLPACSTVTTLKLREGQE